MKSVSTSAAATPTRPSTRAAGARGEQVSETDSSSPRTVELVGPGRVSVDPRAPIDARIEAITDRQRARASRAQLLACGVSASAIVRRVRAGRLELVHQGV